MNFASIDLDGLENQLFLDLRNIKLQVTEIENEYDKDISNLLEFEKDTKSDIHKLWDSIYDMQEVGNTTSRNIDEMYDKDILVLHNFRTETTNQLTKLQKDIDAVLRSAGQGYYASRSGLSEQLSGMENKQFDDNKNSGISSALLVNKIDIIEEEIQNLNDVLKKQKESDNMFRSQLQDVFEDVDSLKGRQRTMTQEQEKLKREIQRLKSEEIIDLTSRLDVIDENIDDIRELQEKSNKKQKTEDTMDNEKLLLVINEMTKLKNQIYYLQQSILILKNNGPNNFGGNDANIDEFAGNGNNEGNVSPTTVVSNPRTINTFTTKFADNAVRILHDESIVNKVEQLSQQINECTPRARFIDLSREMEEKIRECSSEIDSAKIRWRTDKSLSDTYIRRNITRLSRKLIAVSARLEATENDAKKYNLIINGIPKRRKLERTTHLERLVKDFFQTVLGLPRIQFDEVQRIKPEGKNGFNETNKNQREAIPVLVKFPSVRTKTSVLKASRSMSNEARRTYSVGEDFTDTIKHHRRRLVAFARKRAKITKKKWALKYNELYMNGRVFIFMEDKNRVVPKRIK